MKAAELDSRAEEEIAESALYYEGKVAGLGVDFTRAVFAAIDAIRANPTQYGFRATGSRRFLMKRFPYSIEYMDLPGKVLIIALAHHKQRPNYWVNRIDERNLT